MVSTVKNKKKRFHSDFTTEEQGVGPKKSYAMTLSATPLQLAGLVRTDSFWKVRALMRLWRY